MCFGSGASGRDRVVRGSTTWKGPADILLDGGWRVSDCALTFRGDPTLLLPLLSVIDVMVNKGLAK